MMKLPKKAPEKFTDLSPEIRRASREAYAGNETDTDEYRETQPGKGLGVVAGIFRVVGESGGMEPASSGSAKLDSPSGCDSEIGGEEASRRHILMRACDLAKAWLEAVGSAYAGASELAPLCGIYHDLLWAQNEHPYYDDPEELLEVLRDTEDDVEDVD